MVDKVTVGIAVSDMTLIVLWLTDEDAQPVIVLVTDTVNIPLPLAEGFATLYESSEPVAGEDHEYVTAVDGVEAILNATVGLEHVVVTDGEAIKMLGGTVS